MALTVHIQPRDGSWIALGTQQDGGHGVVPESITLTGDLSEYGCLAASFKLRQNPKWISHHIEHFTPVLVKNGDTPVWSGRIIATPTTYGESDVDITVECQGWGQHLKDDCTDREWVIADLSRWQDMKGGDVALANINHGCSVTTGEGIITLAIPANNQLTQNRGAGVILDLGENNSAEYIAVAWDHNGAWGANTTLYARAGDTPDPITEGGTNAFSHALTTATDRIDYGVFATPGRYVSLFWFWTGANTTASADGIIRIKDVSTFTDSSDVDASLFGSGLTASTVISEALDATAPLISTDRAKITATTTALPNFPGTPGRRYANELIDAANAIHGYAARLSPDPVPVFEFEALPTDYSYMVGVGEYTLLEPAAQDGRTVYSRIVGEFENASGVRGSAASSVPSGATVAPANAVAMTNPSFATNLAGWTAGAGALLTRDTGTFDTTPACLLVDGWSPASVPYVAEGTFTGTFLKGTPYVLTFRARFDSSTEGKSCHNARFGYGAGIPGGEDYAISSLVVNTAGAFATYEIMWIPRETRASGVTFSIDSDAYGVTASLRLDTFSIGIAGANVVLRRGFQRTALRPMGIKSTAATALALAQLELDNSQYPPFRGTIGVTGSIRQKGGTRIHVSELVHRVGDAILIEDLSDPNTGNLGRQGIIQKATYDEKAQRVQLEIDRADRFIAQLRARLSLGA